MYTIYVELYFFSRSNHQYIYIYSLLLVFSLNLFSLHINESIAIF